MTHWTPEPTIDQRPPLRRSTDSRIAGVSAGIGHSISVDANIIRVLFVVLAGFGGSGFLAYLGAWLLMPPPAESAGYGFEPATAGVTKPRATTPLVLGGVLLGFAVLLALFTFDNFPGIPFGIVLLFFAGIALLNRRSTTDVPFDPAAYQPPSTQTPYPPQAMHPPASPSAPASTVSPMVTPPPMAIPPASDPTAQMPTAPSVPDEPDEEPSEDQPSEDQPSEDEPSEDEPSEDEPSEDEPSEDEPSEDEPSEDGPLLAEPPLEITGSETTTFDTVSFDTASFDTAGFDSAGSDSGEFSTEFDTGGFHSMGFDPIPASDVPPLDLAPTSSFTDLSDPAPVAPIGPRPHWAVPWTAEETTLASAQSRPPGAPLASITIAAIAAVLGVALVLNTLADIFVGAVAVTGIGLAFVGIAIATTAYRGRTLPLIPIAAVLSAFLVASPIIDHGLKDGTGSQNFAVNSVDDLRSSYALGVGEIVLDLTRLEITEDTTVEVEVGTGGVEIWLPPDLIAEVHADANVGWADVLGRTRGGINPRLHVLPSLDVEPNSPRLLILASVDIGGIDVYRTR